MLERISTGVVSLKIDVPRAFDTERNQSSQATGFVVDAERGLILTNRHVITPAPVRAEALFLNQEEVPLVAVYRDPVHDFGVFSYDPSALRFIDPVELQLRPENAAVGLDVRIVGNDAGEQLSILSGTIARLDRRAPFYGYANYSDFNTFYIQAASGSSGGSSGSPVLDRQGDVVALNAGASATASTSFFLPLQRVQRALDLIRAGEPVARGTLQTQFVQLAYAELRRLGLTEATESHFRQRFSGQIGMLTVNNIIRGSAAAQVLQVGDILLAVNNSDLTDFVALEAILDDSVGSNVTVSIERNGVLIEHSIEVSDLHALTPDNYIQFGDGVVHELSYQQAWHVNKALRGIYVAAPGYTLGTARLPVRSVIEEVNGRPVATLDEFESALDELADGQEASLRFYTMEDASTSRQAIMRMDRRWFPAARCHRDDASGEWPCVHLAEPPPRVPESPKNTEFVEQDDRSLRSIARSLVLVNFDMPYAISGVTDQHYYGTGLVVDTEKGLVVVDRNTVPEAMGDVRLTFAGSLEIRGRVEFVHPFHNLAVVSYDPLLLGDTPVHAATLISVAVTPGAELRAVGLRPDSKLVSQPVQVASVDPLVYPLSRTLRFRETNLEAISLATAPRGIDGVLIDKRSRVVALWSSFAYDVGEDVREDSKGVPVDSVIEALKIVSSGRPLWSLEIELSQLPIATARNFGLPDEWADRMLRHDPERRQVLRIVRTVAGTPAAELLKSGDLVLAVDGATVNRFREVEKSVQRDSVVLTLWRDNEELQVTVATVPMDGRGVRHLVHWSGALLQEPYRDMAAQRSIEPTGVHIADFNYGSPASRAGLWAGSRIVEVDGEPVANLDEFIRLVTRRGNAASIQLRVLGWNDAVEMVTLKPDPVFWPTWEIRHNGDWYRLEIDSQSVSPDAQSE